MFVTVYTDASFKDHKASWAVWIKSEQGTIKLHDRILVSVDGPAHAEMVAVQRAFHAVLREQWTVSILFINTDCMAVCHAFWPWMNQKNPNVNRIANAIKKTAKKNNITIRVKHVKAHTGNDDVRSYLNRWCDHHSKKSRPK